MAEWTPLVEQEDADAQYNLGIMYVKEAGVLKDTKRAHMWWSLASYNDNKIGSEYKAKLAKRMTPADLSKAQDMSSRCLESGYTDC